MAVVHYSAVDADAPLLVPSVASLNGLLATCLNIGYTGKSAAGWAIPYDDSYEKTVFRSGSGSRQRYFRVYDNDVIYPNMASIYGFETMSDVDTGTGKFPTDSQIVTPAYSSIVKSTITDIAARNWDIVADSKLCILYINPEASINGANGCLYIFGDFVSLSASDEYNTLLIGRITNSSAVSGNGLSAATCTIANTVDGHHAARSYTQLGTSIRLGKHGDNYNAGIQFPNPVDGGLIMSRYWLTEANVLRGYIPGLWYLAPAASNFTHGDTFNGTGDLTGKTFMIVKVYGAALAVETSNTWYT